MKKGTLLFLANDLSYNACTELNLSIENQLESTFIEIVNSRKSKIAFGYLWLTSLQGRF